MKNKELIKQFRNKQGIVRFDGYGRMTKGLTWSKISVISEDNVLKVIVNYDNHNLEWRANLNSKLVHVMPVDNLSFHSIDLISRSLSKEFDKIIILNNLPEIDEETEIEFPEYSQEIKRLRKVYKSSLPRNEKGKTAIIMVDSDYDVTNDDLKIKNYHFIQLKDIGKWKEFNTNLNHRNHYFLDKFYSKR